MTNETPKRRPSISQLSKTPSWVMVGFILGALVVLALPRKIVAPRPIIVAAPERTPVRTSAPQISIVEAVFLEWSAYAVWDRDVTQVALWNKEVGDYAEYFEVRRIDGAFYFRTLPRLTNRVIRHGKLPPPECPLQFTETEEQYRDWREHGRTERPVEPLRIERTAPTAPQPSGIDVAPIAPLPSGNVSLPPRQ